MNSERDRDPREDMAFLKQRWLYASVGLVVLLCVAIGAFLAWRANQPVESKTVYVLPEPNPERAELLKRMAQPRKVAYAPKASDEETADSTTIDGSLEVSGSKSATQENDFEEENLESVLAELDEEPPAEKSDFPPVPEDYPFKPVWLGIPGYKKGDKPEHELISRVLIKLWNQGERDFRDGVYNHNRNKVYPLYPDVVYIELAEDGTVVTSTWMQSIPFDANDFATGEWKTKYPGIKFVEFDDAGYDPYTFLTDDD